MAHEARRDPPAPLLVVGVGASAGGLEAFRALLSSLPEDSGMSFLFVQHLDPTQQSHLTELLRSYTGMRVVQAEDGAPLRPDTVYVIRPNTALGVRSGRIELSAPLMRRGLRLPVDHLFRSLARELGGRAVGIVLSGSGSDGSAGLRDIRAAGGLAIAQEPTTSAQDGMPRSAIESDVTDMVLPIQKIPEALDRFAHLPKSARLEATQHPDSDAAEARRERLEMLGPHDLSSLASLLDTREDFDIRVYKPGTIERRVLRRMALADMASADDYLERLAHSSGERHALVGDLLISVTDFFRDAEAFGALRRRAIEPLVEAASAGDVLRCWVPGCATGEEAYSVAMEFLDVIDTQEKPLDLQIFATDLDAEAIAVARAGCYPQPVLGRISSRRLQKYFTPRDGNRYQLTSPVRDKLSFAVHDLTKDPPFSRMHLVSCRNLLIYLRPKAQQQVLSALHFALNPNGYLFLGSSESTRPNPALFSTVSKRWRIYKRDEARRPKGLAHSGFHSHRERSSSATAPQTAGRPRASASHAARDGDEVRRAILGARVPPTVVVSEDGFIRYMHGELRPYLRFPEGPEMRFELAGMMDPDFATRARAALYKCRREQESVVALSSPNETKKRTKITATPAAELGEGAVILSFEEMEGADVASAEPPSAEQEAIIEELEKELAATREDLRSTVDELETSNEELRSSNEEVTSMNEELQSSNEELEATTEELRSLNEELTTVNTQLREKVDEVEQAHNDLSNFFESTKIATLFLDERLCVKRFTPAAEELLGIGKEQVGRRVGDIARELLQNELASEARSVLEHLTPVSRELPTAGRRWVRRDILPYRTGSQRIEGVVVSLVDISDVKRATMRLQARERQQAVVARLGLQALQGPDLQGFLDQLVRDVQETLGTDYCKVLELQPGGESVFLRAGVGWRTGLVGQADVPTGLDSQAGYTLQSDQPVIVADLSKEKRFSGPSLLVEHGVVSGLSCVIRGEHGPYGVIGCHTRERREFTQEDANFLQAVAGVIGSATSRHQTRARLAVESGVGKALAESCGWMDATPRVLSCFARELGVDVAELWWRDADGDALHCHATRAAARQQAVKKHFSRGRFRPNEGLVGRVAQEGRAEWATSLADDQRFLRAAAAGELGLSSALAFPVTVGEEVLGVISLFSRQRLLADAGFLHSLESLGRAIGDFHTRVRAQEHARRLAAVVESSHDAIVTYDFDGHITGWLGGAQALYGHEADEVLGASIDRLMPSESRQEHLELIERVRSGETAEPRESLRVSKKGRSVDVSVRLSPIKDDAGRITGVASTERDIRHQKKVERKLVEADRQKNEFLAMLGHELRNPLAAIRNAVELFAVSEGDTEVLQRAQAVIDRQSAHMAKLLDGLLDVSRIIRGKISVETRVVDLTATCRDVVADVIARNAGRELEIRSVLPSEPVWVDADPTRLTQIVDNLLGNAVKYTADGGHIVLSVGQDGHVATIEVSDDGAGIEPQLLPHIFEVFRQATQSLDRSSGGLGLGLPLVKSLVELHGGSVEAISEGEGKGATFRVRLPVTDAPASERGSADVAAPVWRVLVVEDNEDAAQMLRQLLERAGHRVVVATRGSQAVPMVKEHASELVICDLGLPEGITGYDVARDLRTDPATRHVKLVALSGYGRPEDKTRTSEAGFDAHVTKPVDIRTLQRTLQRLGRA